MANLDLIKRLNIRYGKSSPLLSERKFFSLNESSDPDIILEAISDSTARLGTEFTKYFNNGLPADVVLLFIDVCGFSTRFSHFNGEEMGEYFDEYYDIVIPLIYKYGGEIDKIIGDGIVCVFGPPFQNIDLVDNIRKANMCSKKIIRATMNTKYSSKIALHCGTVNYFKNKSGFYKEFTLVGKPLTELFRLESISKEQSINYYYGTDIYDYYQDLYDYMRSLHKSTNWVKLPYLINNLKGVTFKKFYSLKYND